MSRFGHSHASTQWEEVGRAAESFARRVARDARRFAWRIERHAGHLADEVAEEVGHTWRGCADRARARSSQHSERAPGDIRAAFAGVRSVVTEVLDHLDDMIAKFAPTSSETTESSGATTAAEGPIRIISHQDSICTGCENPIAAGTDCWLEHENDIRRFRCLECGPSKAKEQS